MVAEIDKGAKRSLFQSFVDTTTAKLTTYRNIVPRTTTLNKLRNGKTCKAHGPSRHIGTGRVLSRQVLNEGLTKLELAEATKIAREQAALERKLAAEERKNAKQAVDKQWKFNLDLYADQMAAWREEVAVLDTAWKPERDKARMAHKRPPKKPTQPIPLKRPIKPKVSGLDLMIGGFHLTVVEEGEEAGVGPEGDIQPENDPSEEMVEFMQDLDLGRFEQML